MSRHPKKLNKRRKKRTCPSSFTRYLWWCTSSLFWSFTSSLFVNLDRCYAEVVTVERFKYLEPFFVLWPLIVRRSRKSKVQHVGLVFFIPLFRVEDSLTLLMDVPRFFVRLVI